MKGVILILLVHLFVIFACQTTGAIEVYEGKLQDVVVAASGTSDSTLVTELADGWFVRGPNSFDIDKDRNIYILDWLGEKVVTFDKQGNWLLTFKVPSDSFIPGTRSIWLSGSDPAAHRPRSDIAVDNWGNVCVTARDGSVLKFSPEGRLLFRLPYKSDELIYLEVDKSGRFYNFPDWRYPQTVGVGMYDPEGLMKMELVYDFEYPDRLIVQKEAGDELYFRVGKYLTRTTLEDYLATGKLDSVAILPNKLRLLKYEDEGVEHDLPLPPPYILLGFDKEHRFYFLRLKHFYGHWMYRFCQTYGIGIWRLENEELHLVSGIDFEFVKGKDPECSDKVLWDFAKNKQFIVSGDGTIYFMHGTVDTIKVSKIIMD
jgi:hypothetical protein